MRSWAWPRTVRARLTLWYALVLALMLAGAALASWYTLGQVLIARTDAFLADARDAFAVELGAEWRDTPALPQALRSALRDVRFSDIAFVLLDTLGRRVHGEELLVPPAHGGLPSLALPEPDLLRGALAGADPRQKMLRTIVGDPGGDSARQEWRVALAPVRLGEQAYVVAALQGREWFRATRALVAEEFLIAIPLLLAIASAGGWLLARHALAPVADMSHRARAIEARNLNERLPVGNAHDELGELATVINALLARLEHAFAQQRQFVGDASHELGTPLAIIRTEAEIALARDSRPEAEYRAALGAVQDAGSRLSRVVDDLLFLARADGGPVPMRRAPLYLEEVVDETVDVVRSLARHRDVRLAVESLQEAPYDGDAELLRRLVLNLCDNAIKYSPRGGCVRVRLAREDDAYVVEVIDEGPGIPPEARERVFERYYRVDPERTPVSGERPRGTGLGLAIARRIASAHGGTLVVAESSRRGTTFRLRLPLAGTTAGRS